MKKLITLMAALAITCGVSAQTKTAYLDLYQRGGGLHLKTNVSFDQKSISLAKTNLGETLNALSEMGWSVDQTFTIRRHGVPITRHKFHVILKKEYTNGENPFEGLRQLKQETKNSKKR